MFVFTENRRDFNFTGNFYYEELDQDFNQDGKMVIDGCFVFTDKGQLLIWVSEWLTDLMERNVINHNTAREYGKVITYFLEYLIEREHRFKRPKPKGVKDIQELLLSVTKPIVLEYLNIHCKDISNGVRGFRDVVIKSFYEQHICNVDYGDNKGVALLDEFYNPFKVSDPNSEAGTKKLFNGKSNINDEGGGGAISIDNLIDFMIMAKDERERGLFQFMYDSGLRVGEIPFVKRSDITEALTRFSNKMALDEEENALIESNYKALIVKGVKPRNRAEFKPRVTHVSTMTIKRLNRYFTDRFGFYKKHTNGMPIEEQYAFLNTVGNPISKHSVEYLVTTRFKEGKQIGLFQGRSIPVTAHKFRHGFAVACMASPDVKLDSHDRMVALSLWLGHSNVGTTEKHYQSIAVELQHNLETGELLNRCDLMAEVYSQTKPSQIESTKKKRIKVASNVQV